MMSPPSPRPRPPAPLALLALLLGPLACLDPDEPGNLVPKTVDEDPSLPAIEANGIRLHAEFFGDPAHPIIIFNHPGGADYRALISEFGAAPASRYPAERAGDGQGLTRLQDDHYLVFYDHRGTGLSPRFDRGSIELEVLIDDLDAIVDLALERKEQLSGIRDERVTLFGWSFGGVLATGYTNTHPERVQDVITFEHGPLTTRDFEMLDLTSPLAQIATVRLDEWLYGTEHVARDTHARADYMLAVGVNRVYPELHANGAQPAWRLGAFAIEDLDEFGSMIEGNRLVDGLDAFPGRFLYLVGARNESLDAAEKERWAAHYPDHRIVEIPGTGHSGAWEQSAAVVDAMREFLAEGK